MGEVQGILHVQPGLSSAKDEDDRISDRHDSLRDFRIRWNSRVIRYPSSPIKPEEYTLTSLL